MSQSLSDFIYQLPIIDVHEHHLPETFAGKEVGQLDLFRQSYAGWTQARRYPLPSETIDEDLMGPALGGTSWEQIAACIGDCNRINSCAVWFTGWMISMD